MKFKVGDKVLHQKGNVPRTGEIVFEPDTAKFWGYKGEPLAFYGENNYFEWLEIAEPYLKLL